MRTTKNSTHTYGVYQIVVSMALAAVSCLAVAGAPVNLTGIITWKNSGNSYVVTDSSGAVIANAWDFEYQDSGDTVDPSIIGTVSKPSASAGPYAGVLVSHGLGGNAAGFSTSKAPWFAPANYLTIAVDYTHANPATSATCNIITTYCGGSVKNVGRAKKALDILHSQQLINKLGDIVNRDQTFLYGNSMGAMVTVELAQTISSTLKAAAITAGGIFADSHPKNILTPSGVAGLVNMNTPLMQLHGTADTVVPFLDGQRLSDNLTAYGKVHQAQWKIGAGHSIHLATSTGDFVLAWFDTYRNSAAPIISSVSTRKDRTTAVVQANIRGTGFGVNPAHDTALQEQDAPNYPYPFSGVSQLIFDNDGTDTTAGTQVAPTTWANELINSVVPATVPSTGELSVTIPVGPLEVNKAYFWDPIGGARSNLFKYTVPQ